MTLSASLAEILPTINKYYESTKSLHIPIPQRRSVPNVEIPSLSLAAATTQFEATLRGHNLSTEMYEMTMQRAAEVATLYRDSYAKTCRQLLEAPHAAFGPPLQDTVSSLRRTYEHLYETKDLPGFLTTALRGQKLSQQRVTAPERLPFNHAFIPYLEAYFEQNAYPSHADLNTLTAKGKMERGKIVNWFQNRRNRLRAAGRESEIRRLPAGQAINVAMIEESIEAVNRAAAADNVPVGDDGTGAVDSAPESAHLKLDDLVSSSNESVPKTFDAKSSVPCVADIEAFDLPSSNRSQPPVATSPPLNVDALNEALSSFNIRVGASATPEPVKPHTSKRGASPRATPSATKARKAPLKATLRSCFSAAITLTCPSVHPSLIRQKTRRTSPPLPSSKSTILEQKHVPTQPYILPTVLPSWELSAAPTTEPVRRKKPTLASHAGKTRPGSPYPKQTLSRVSSSSSLASMTSIDSQSSSRSVSSTSSASTLESLELETPAQSPSINPVELVDDPRFPHDLFGDYLFNPDPFRMDFSSFDLNVEEPFDKDVSLSFAEFEQPISLSIADFDSTTVPSFDFFES